MAFSYNGYDVNCITFYKDANDNKYTGPITLNENGKVTRAASGTEVFAVAVANRGNLVTVQTRGYVELKYSGSNAPSYGRVKLASDGAGGVAVNLSNGTLHTVLKVDTVNKIVGFML